MKKNILVVLLLAVSTSAFSADLTTGYFACFENFRGFFHDDQKLTLTLDVANLSYAENANLWAVTTLKNKFGLDKMYVFPAKYAYIDVGMAGEMGLQFDVNNFSNYYMGKLSKITAEEAKFAYAQLLETAQYHGGRKDISSFSPDYEEPTPPCLTVYTQLRQ